jgi:hypothetical protein
MSHKLQPSSRTNHGLDSVVRRADSTSQPEIPSNDAGSTPTGAEVDNHPHRAGFDLDNGQTPGQSWLNSDLVKAPRCEVARSEGYDPTGERAIACGAQAEVLCEHCGPMCAACAEDTFCDCGDHKLTPLEQPVLESKPGRARRPVSAVVYIEITCPKCGRVRVALPLNHRPMAKRKCPECKTMATARYLAHGVTRRRLPYHEVFEMETDLQPDSEFKTRVPWDHRPNWWVEE